MPTATGHEGLHWSAAAAANASQPEAFSPGNKPGRESMQAWANDVADPSPYT